MARVKDLNAKIVAQLAARGVASATSGDGIIAIDRIVQGKSERFQINRPVFVTHDKLDAIAEQMKQWMQANGVPN